MWTLAFSIALGIAMAEVFRMFLRAVLERLSDVAADATSALEPRRRRSAMSDAAAVAPVAL